MDGWISLEVGGEEVDLAKRAVDDCKLHTGVGKLRTNVGSIPHYSSPPIQAIFNSWEIMLICS